MSAHDTLHLHIEAGTAPDKDLDELVSEVRKLATMAGADPDESLAFTIVRRDTVRKPRWWGRAWRWLRR